MMVQNPVVQQRMLKNILNTAHITRESIRFNKRIEELKEAGESLETIKGIGKATVKTLYEKGIKTTEQLRTVSEEYLRTIITNPLAIHGVLIHLNKEKEIGQDSEQLKTVD